MKSYVGTSGWAYKNWNPDGLPWYASETGFNAIELNMSFYRYPTTNNVKEWLSIASHLTWVVKVNQSFTHRYRFSDESFYYWRNFKQIYKAMDKRIAFYLFQLPPSMKPAAMSRIEAFFKHTRLKTRFALEWRHKDWWSTSNIVWAQQLGLTLVSVDAPDLPRDVFNTSGSVYLRTHGRKEWYFHDYTFKELKEIAEKIKAAQPTNAYVFFNNENFMLKNGQKMMSLLQET